MNAQEKEQISKMIEDKLMEEYRRGIAVGIKSACNVVSARLNDKTKSFMDRIKSVNDFCKAPFRLDMSEKEPVEEKTDDVPAAPTEYPDAVPEEPNE